jgi:Mrp family chromosome partitioning ATPase
MDEVVESPLEQPSEAPLSLPVEEAFCSNVSLETSAAAKDEIAKLVQKLFVASQSQRCVVFAGTESESGCSWMCARIAEGLAAQGHGSVCVVDWNLRSPGLHQQFGVENHHGLSDALLGPGHIREYTRRWSQNLWCLSCGASAETSLKMLGSDRMRARLAELQSAFDYVLIDAAPLNAGNDAVILGGLSDGIVLILKANSSRRQTARNAMQELQNAKVRVLGAVLNERTFPVPEALYKRL